MDDQKTILHLIHDDMKPAGAATRHAIPQKVRRQKALKSFLPYAGLGLLCLPIPLLHFILVPLFLSLGGVKAWSYLSATGEITEGEVACPRCSEKIHFHHIPENWPLKLLCEKCGYPVRLHLAAEG